MICTKIFQEIYVARVVRALNRLISAKCVVSTVCATFTNSRHNEFLWEARVFPAKKASDAKDKGRVLQKILRETPVPLQYHSL